MQEKFPTLKQIAVFDTSFHVNSVPEKTYRYAIPENWYEKYNVRRYGFHGTSHKYVACEAAKLLDKPIEDLKIITAHLGHGCRYILTRRSKFVVVLQHSTLRHSCCSVVTLRHHDTDKKHYE